MAAVPGQQDTDSRAKTAVLAVKDGFGRAGRWLHALLFATDWTIGRIVKSCGSTSSTGTRCAGRCRAMPRHGLAVRCISTAISTSICSASHRASRPRTCESTIPIGPARRMPPICQTSPSPSGSFRSSSAIRSCRSCVSIVPTSSLSARPTDGPIGISAAATQAGMCRRSSAS